MKRIAAGNGVNDTFPESNPRKPVAVVAIITALCLMGDSMLYITLPIYFPDVGLSSLWEVGILLAINRFVRLPLNPLAGWMYQKFPLRAVLIAAIVIGSFTTLGYGLCRGFWLWLILRSLWGLAWSLLRMGGYATVVQCSNAANRGQLMGMYNGLYRLGSLSGMLLGGLLAPWIGMSLLALIFGGLSLAGLVILTAGNAVGEPQPANERPKDSSTAMSWSTATAKVIVSGFGTSMLFQGLMASTLSYVILSQRGPALSIGGLSIAAATLSGVLLGARWVWEPFAADRFGRWSDGPFGRKPLLTGTLLGAALGFLLIPWPLPLWIWIAVVCWVLLMATALTTLVDVLAADLAKQHSLTVMTYHSIFTDLGAALGPVAAYWFIGLTNGLSITYIGSAIFLLVLCGWWGVELVRLRSKEQHENSPSI